MKGKLLVKICEGKWVNPRQVCYVRDDSEDPDMAYIGFHGGTEVAGGVDKWTNELQVLVKPKKVVRKLEEWNNEHRGDGHRH